MNLVCPNCGTCLPEEDFPREGDYSDDYPVFDPSPPAKLERIVFRDGVEVSREPLADNS